MVVNGTEGTIEGIGDLPVLFNGDFYIFREVRFMPSNPECTLSPGSMKRLDNFLKAAHDVGTDFQCKHKNSKTYHFVSNKDMAFINAMDYVTITLGNFPIDTYCNHQEIFEQASAVTTQTASKRKIIPTQKCRQNQDIISDNIKLKPSENRSRISRAPKLGNILSDATEVTPQIPQINQDEPQDIIQLKEGALTEDDMKHLQDQESLLLAHLKFGCRCPKSLKHMGTSKSLKNIPTFSKIPVKTWKCPICHIMKMPRLPTSVNISMESLAPGQFLYIDFAFMSIPSARGFSSYLSATDHTTGYPFGFPSRNKRPPLDLIRFLVLTLQRLGKAVNFVRVDEGGELARCSEINKLLINMQVVVHTTGGRASQLNRDE